MGHHASGVHGLDLDRSRVVLGLHTRDRLTGVVLYSAGCNDILHSVSDRASSRHLLVPRCKRMPRSLTRGVSLDLIDLITYCP